MKFTDELASGSVLSVSLIGAEVGIKINDGPELVLHPWTAVHLAGLLLRRAEQADEAMIHKGLGLAAPAVKIVEVM